ncbi:hypothetical protein [Chitinophaga silvisoli]|uniref:Uncharacterized protein n=1 Tax=Chitinophaga silvisoli TaxID=2291814 RepID=A0A3E1NU94_9BACT|nr:hypothetical protein [Chitinophaga silvisoli]RFM31511.1 hypothetical protein DXN04_27705 [Chitinophaga silvisoli]
MKATVVFVLIVLVCMISSGVLIAQTYPKITGYVGIIHLIVTFGNGATIQIRGVSPSLQGCGSNELQKELSPFNLMIALCSF